MRATGTILKLLLEPQNESEASLPQALCLGFVTFTPSHEITLGTRATGTISEVQTKPVTHSPLGQRGQQC